MFMHCKRLAVVTSSNTRNACILYYHRGTEITHCFSMCKVLHHFHSFVCAIVNAKHESNSSPVIDDCMLTIYYILATFLSNVRCGAYRTHSESYENFHDTDTHTHTHAEKHAEISMWYFIVGWIITFRSSPCVRLNELFTNCVVQISINLVFCLFRNMLRYDCSCAWAGCRRVFRIRELSYEISNSVWDWKKKPPAKWRQAMPRHSLSAHPAAMRARHGIASSQIQFELYYFYYNICLHAGAIYVLLLKCGYLRAPTPSFAIENMCRRKESAQSAT